MNGKLKSAEAFKAGSRPAPAVRASDTLELQRTVSDLGNNGLNLDASAIDARRDLLPSLSGEDLAPVVPSISKGRTPPLLRKRFRH
jgi:hypothetical protein